MFIDDILVYSKNEKEHTRHLRVMLQTLQEHKLYAKFLKCEFWITSLKFLGHVVSQEGISVDPQMVKAVEKWHQPTIVIEI